MWRPRSRRGGWGSTLPTFSTRRLGSGDTGRRGLGGRAGKRGWAHASGHNRGQILYYVAENLAVRAAQFTGLLDAMTALGEAAARSEVDAAVARLFSYAAWADKYDGAVHQTPIRGITLAMNEP